MTDSQFYLIASIVCGAAALLIVVWLVAMKKQFSFYKRAVWFYLGDNPSNYYNESMVLSYWHEGITPEICAQRLVSIKSGLIKRRQPIWKS